MCNQHLVASLEAFNNLRSEFGRKANLFPRCENGQAKSRVPYIAERCDAAPIPKLSKGEFVFVID